MQETQFQSLGWEDPLEEEMGPHFNILTWEILWTQEPGGLQSIGLQRVRRDWATSVHTHTLNHSSGTSNYTFAPLFPKSGPVSLKSPALVSRFFTASVSWEAPLVTLRDDKIATELAEASDA